MKLREGVSHHANQRAKSLYGKSMIILSSKKKGLQTVNIKKQFKNVQLAMLCFLYDKSDIYDTRMLFTHASSYQS